jgi:hypothetical protein
VPVWYEAPLEMNEGGQGYNRLHSRSAVDRPNTATFKPLRKQANAELRRAAWEGLS